MDHTQHNAIANFIRVIAHDVLRTELEQDLSQGKDVVLDYEPDTEPRDSEQVPMSEPGGIEAFFRREALPHVPDAWIESEWIRETLLAAARRGRN